MSDYGSLIGKEVYVRASIVSVDEDDREQPIKVKFKSNPTEWPKIEDIHPDSLKAIKSVFISGVDEQIAKLQKLKEGFL